ncbi:hypothetical protein, partial [Cumulibacter manganitolerans]|uniref:hypothetical protein n=1 Tax=Cumulibacter manganitolerans TaxID=1884992 RepID=UPI0012961DAD
MIAAALGLALALVTWPDSVPAPVAHRRRSGPAVGAAVDRAMPYLLGGVVGALLLAVASGPGAVPPPLTNSILDPTPPGWTWTPTCRKS